MFNFKTSFILLFIICVVATALTAYCLGGISPDLIKSWLKNSGIWAPVTYVIIYVVATILVLPSTALNLTGGAIFGPWLGTCWTSTGAIVAAIAAFIFARTIGYNAVAKRLAGRWQAIDAEIRQGGVYYMFAIRLLPIMPYGLVNFAAGLSSVSFKDYLIGTILGTVPSVLPFVLLGSSGLKAIRTGEVMPLVGALALLGMLVAGSTWYRRRRRFPFHRKR
ncbi:MULTISPECIES: TVP38/TMEM64 family protein [Calothrix]|uniref:TVP38/TMEM64 family membrane protein n=2 Tax=Calothrix TaxID=1186 RepID=A0ABR8A9J5_9CYAN|nr:MULTISPECIES: TVP38/TMEM64 family protein [Calothrix]MBD2196125.1 TVP38/TMEM64 family protein [Calothrix parietina FACHB-288]MBD2224776.1 TVP38/TMEM64 family protein [Calothrix anomala FACHB-343]